MVQCTAVKGVKTYVTSCQAGQVAQKLHYILTPAAKFAISANQAAKHVQPISQKNCFWVLHHWFKVKPFGVLLSIDIAVSVKRLLNERTMPIDNKTPNCLTFINQSLIKEMHETPQPEILGYAASFLYAAAAVFYSRQWPEKSSIK